MFKSFLSFAVVFLSILTNGSNSKASLRLEEGSYSNRTHIDAALVRANLNFTYKGCDKTFDRKRLQFAVDTRTCKRERVRLKDSDQDGNQAIYISEGKVKVRYKDKTECESEDHTTIPNVTVNRTLRDIYQIFEKAGCRPLNITIVDDDSELESTVNQSTQDPSQCRLPKTHIQKPNFPTEIAEFEMRANNEGFNLGKDVEYKYHHDTGSWCVRYVPANTGGCKKPQDWPGPLPLATCKDTYKDSCKNDKVGNYHVRGTVSLKPDGKAEIRAINRRFNSYRAVFEAQKNGAFNNTEVKKGRIDFQAKRDRSTGIPRAIVRSYDQDLPDAKHQRSIYFSPRNVFGLGVTKTWCHLEHCLAGVSEARMLPYSCKGDPKVNLHNGGSGNLCHSCIGLLPGFCVEGSMTEPNERVQYLRSVLKQTPRFTILNNGEYKMGQNIELGLMSNFDRIIAEPQRSRGCFEGEAPKMEGHFNKGRSVQSAEIFNF